MSLLSQLMGLFERDEARRRAKKPQGKAYRAIKAKHWKYYDEERYLPAKRWKYYDEERYVPPLRRRATVERKPKPTTDPKKPG